MCGLKKVPLWYLFVERKRWFYGKGGILHGDELRAGHARANQLSW
jgi:hypothetical protein